MEYKVEQLLFDKQNNLLYRVINVSNDSIICIEYGNQEHEQKVFSIANDKINDTTFWVKWKPDGSGEKIQLKSLGTISFNKVPQRLITYSQLDRANSFVIKGNAYKSAETNSLTVPEHWEKHTVYRLAGKKEALLCFQANENRKTMMDRAGEADLFVDGKIERLKESDIWLITMV